MIWFKLTRNFTPVSGPPVGANTEIAVPLILTTGAILADVGLAVISRCRIERGRHLTSLINIIIASKFASFTWFQCVRDDSHQAISCCDYYKQISILHHCMYLQSDVSEGRLLGRVSLTISLMVIHLLLLLFYWCIITCIFTNCDCESNRRVYDTITIGS